jgi:hypothetical protein
VPELPAIVAALFLAGLAVFQAALAAGAPLGRFAWGGANEVLPSRLRIASAVAVAAYAALAWIALGVAGLIPTALPTGSPVLWAIALLLGVGTVMNAISRSRPERSVMTPVALVLALCFVALALGA